MRSVVRRDETSPGTAPLGVTWVDGRNTQVYVGRATFRMDSHPGTPAPAPRTGDAGTAPTVGSPARAPRDGRVIRASDGDDSEPFVLPAVDLPHAPDGAGAAEPDAGEPANENGATGGAGGAPVGPPRAEPGYAAASLATAATLVDAPAHRPVGAPAVGAPAIGAPVMVAPAGAVRSRSGTGEPTAEIHVPRRAWALTRLRRSAAAWAVMGAVGGGVLATLSAHAVMRRTGAPSASGAPAPMMAAASDSTEAARRAAVGAPSGETKTPVVVPRGQADVATATAATSARDDAMAVADATATPVPTTPSGPAAGRPDSVPHPAHVAPAHKGKHNEPPPAPSVERAGETAVAASTSTRAGDAPVVEPVTVVRSAPSSSLVVIAPAANRKAWVDPFVSSTPAPSKRARRAVRATRATSATTVRVAPTTAPAAARTAWVDPFAD